MINSTAVRLYDTVSAQHVIVQDGKVYGDRDGDGKISKQEELPASARRDALLDAAQEMQAVSPDGRPRGLDMRVPGNKNKDGTVVTAGLVNLAELADFEKAGTLARRPQLQEHLAIFDVHNRGKFNLIENYQGWRMIPPFSNSRLKAIKQTLGSAAVFSFLRFKNAGHSVIGSILGAMGTGLTIDVSKIGSSRPSGSSWIYGKDGNIDEARFAEFTAHFKDVADEQGVMKQLDAKKVIDELVKLGTIPGKQFESFWAVATAMNHSDTVTIDQFRWLYDGSLLWRAAALTNNGGHSTLGQ